jgi:uncharacterized protein (TIGR00299 family) protein
VRVAYFDCFSGISGDMALAALVDAGADLNDVAKVLGRLPLEGVTMQQEEVEAHAVTAVRVHVDAPPQGVIRTYANIRLLLADAEMPDAARRTAQRAYRLLADALGRVHGKEPDLVTFHEFGEVDCLVDIVGCAVALELLGVERVFSSPIPTGLGMIRTEHGMMPVPSPLVVELLQGVPTYSRGIPAELVTPTGAAILAAVSEGYGDMPMMVAEQVGYGAGHLRLDFPHVVRVVIGEELRVGTAGSEHAGEVVVEALVDALDEGGVQRLIEALLHAGAGDAWVIPVLSRGGSVRSNASAVAPARLAGAVGRVLGSAPGAGAIRRTALLPPG